MLNDKYSIVPIAPLKAANNKKNIKIQIVM